MIKKRDPLGHARMLQRLYSAELKQELFGPHATEEILEIEHRLEVMNHQPEPQQELSLSTR